MAKTSKQTRNRNEPPLSARVMPNLKRETINAWNEGLQGITYKKKQVSVARLSVVEHSKGLLEKLMHESNINRDGDGVLFSSNYSVSDDYTFKAIDYTNVEHTHSPHEHAGNNHLQISLFYDEKPPLYTQTQLRTLINPSTSVHKESGLSAPLVIHAFQRQAPSDFKETISQNPGLQSILGRISSAFSSQEQLGLIRPTHPPHKTNVTVHATEEGGFRSQSCTLQTLSYSLDDALDITHTSVSHDLDVNTNRFIAECVQINSRANKAPFQEVKIIATNHSPQQGTNEQLNSQTMCHVIGLSSHLVGQSANNSLSKSTTIIPSAVGIAQTAMAIRGLRHSTQTGSISESIYEPLRTDPYLQSSHVIPLFAVPGFTVTLLRCPVPVESGPRHDAVFVHTHANANPVTTPIEPRTVQFRTDAVPPKTHANVNSKTTRTKKQVISEKANVPATDNMDDLFADIDPYMAPPGSSLHMMSMLDNIVRNS